MAPSRATTIVPAITPPEAVNPRIPIVITTPTQTVVTILPAILLPPTLFKKRNKKEIKICSRVETIGSYYYSNPSGSTYYNDGQGGSKYTPPSGKK